MNFSVLILHGTPDFIDRDDQPLVSKYVLSCAFPIPGSGFLNFGLPTSSRASDGWSLFPSRSVSGFIRWEVMNLFENLIKALGTQCLQNAYKRAHECYYNLAHFLAFKGHL